MGWAVGLRSGNAGSRFKSCWVVKRNRNKERTEKRVDIGPDNLPWPKTDVCETIRSLSSYDCSQDVTSTLRNGRPLCGGAALQHIQQTSSLGPKNRSLLSKYGDQTWRSSMEMLSQPTGGAEEDPDYKGISRKSPPAPHLRHS